MIIWDACACAVRIIKKPHLENLVARRKSARITARRNTINLNNVAPDNRANSSLFMNVTDKPFVSRRRPSCAKSNSVAAVVDLNNDVGNRLDDPDHFEPNVSAIDSFEPETTQKIEVNVPDSVTDCSIGDSDDESNQSHGANNDSNDNLDGNSVGKLDDPVQQNDVNPVEPIQAIVADSVVSSTFDCSDDDMSAFDQSNGINQNDLKTSINNLENDDLDCGMHESVNNDLNGNLNVNLGGNSVGHLNGLFPPPNDPNNTDSLEPETVEQNEPVELNVANSTEPNSEQTKNDNEVLLPFLSPVSSKSPQ